MHQLIALSDPDCACTTLRRATRAVTRLYDAVMAKTGLTIVQFSLLRAIGQRGPLPLMQLAEQQVMERTTLYRALKPLGQRALITLARTDGRAKSVSLTQAGHDAVIGATAAWQHAEALLHGRIDDSEWADLKASLRTLVSTARVCAL
jgi:DNA-binding MarR family transcriptional regulator